MCKWWYFTFCWLIWRLINVSIFYRFLICLMRVVTANRAGIAVQCLQYEFRGSVTHSAEYGWNAVSGTGSQTRGFGCGLSVHTTGPAVWTIELSVGLIAQQTEERCHTRALTKWQWCRWSLIFMVNLRQVINFGLFWWLFSWLFFGCIESITLLYNSYYIWWVVKIDFRLKTALVIRSGALAIAQYITTIANIL